jgi:phosphoglycolate phosphatase
MEADAHQAVAHYRDRYAQRGMFENSVYPGIPPLLAELRRAGHSLILATAKPLVFAEQVVEHFGLRQYLSACHGSELDGTRSDKVELLGHIIEREGLLPHTCSMVGDHANDMAAARYHGMRAIGVLWGYGSREGLLKAGAEHLLAAPAELPGLLSA